NEAGRMADELGAAYLVEIVGQLDTDAAADVLRNLSPDFREKILAEVSPQKCAMLREILSYQPGTAGFLMAKEYLSVPATATVGEATRYVRSLAADRRGRISYIYAVDGEGRLEGVIQVRDLVFYPPEKSVHDILRKPVVQVETGMSQLDVAR